MTTIYLDQNIGVDEIRINTLDQLKQFAEKYISRQKNTIQAKETAYDENGITLGSYLTKQELKDIEEHNKIPKDQLKSASIFINQYL